MNWPDAVELLSKRVVKLITPRGSGTGFILPLVPDSKLIVVATAAHVIDNAHYWEEPIRLQNTANETVLLHSNERAIFINETLDTAVVLFSSDSLAASEVEVELAPEGRHLRIGNEVGWLGYPVVASTNLCFFTGRISAVIKEERIYLIDGVAINGVSGGPAFHFIDNGLIIVMGVISAYIPNRATGEALPGLCVARDVKQFQELTKRFNNLKAAKKKEIRRSTPPPPPERQDGGSST